MLVIEDKAVSKTPFIFCPYGVYNLVWEADNKQKLTEIIDYRVDKCYKEQVYNREN